MNVFIERIQLRLQKLCVENARADVVHAAFLQPTQIRVLRCSLHSRDEMLHSSVPED